MSITVVVFRVRKQKTEVIPFEVQCARQSYCWSVSPSCAVLPVAWSCNDEIKVLRITVLQNSDLGKSCDSDADTHLSGCEIDFSPPFHRTVALDLGTELLRSLISLHKRKYGR